jgi:hypothetical protein
MGPEMLTTAVRGSATSDGPLAQKVALELRTAPSSELNIRAAAVPVSMCSVNERSATLRSRSASAE